jgi:hypothetical protein
MMKKLVCLLILAMASSVFAVGSLRIMVNDQPWDGTDVKPSDIITVMVYEDTANPGSFGFGTLIEVSNGDYIADSFYLMPGGMMGTLTLDPITGGGMVISGNTSYFPGPAYPLPGEELSWQFHVPDYKQPSDMIEITLTGFYGDQQDMSTWSTALHVIPEPMTVALLGLGGLFLRRRK